MGGRSRPASADQNVGVLHMEGGASECNSKFCLRRSIPNVCSLLVIARRDRRTRSAIGSDRAARARLDFCFTPLARSSLSRSMVSSHSILTPPSADRTIVVRTPMSDSSAKPFARHYPFPTPPNSKSPSESPSLSCPPAQYPGMLGRLYDRRSLSRSVSSAASGNTERERSVTF